MSVAEDFYRPSALNQRPTATSWASRAFGDPRKARSYAKGNTRTTSWAGRTVVRKLGCDGSFRKCSNSEIFSATGYVGDTCYNSLQVTANKRFRSGGTLLANYSWSKFLGNSESTNAPAAPGLGRVVLQDVTVVDTGTGALAPHRSIIEGDKIAAITPANAKVLAGARVVRAAGRYVVPGYADMHITNFAQDTPFVPPVLVAKGKNGARRDAHAGQQADRRAIQRRRRRGETGRTRNRL